jgi:excisionase family DNA binding protein
LSTDSNLGPSDVAKLLGVTSMTVRRLSDKGELEFRITPGGHRRFARKDIQSFCDERGLKIQNIEIDTTLKVLVVDDQQVFVDLLREILESSGLDLTVMTANGGFEAGLTVKSFRPDVIFSDLLMPDLDGIEMCKLLKGDEETSGIRIIGITGTTNPSDIQRFLEAGAEACLSKPVKIDELIQSLTREQSLARTTK